MAIANVTRRYCLIMAQGLVIAGIYADFGKWWGDCKMRIDPKKRDCKAVKIQ